MPLLVPFCFQTHPLFGLPTPVHLDRFLPAPPFQLHPVLQKKAHPGRVNPIFLLQPPMLPFLVFVFRIIFFRTFFMCFSWIFFCQFLFYNWLRFVIPWCRSVDWSDDEPYKCTICGKCFSWAGNMRTRICRPWMMILTTALSVESASAGRAIWKLIFAAHGWWSLQLRYLWRVLQLGGQYENAYLPPMDDDPDKCTICGKSFS